jgi:hypothetical protein
MTNNAVELSLADDLVFGVECQSEDEGHQDRRNSVGAG